MRQSHKTQRFRPVKISNRKKGAKSGPANETFNFADQKMYKKFNAQKNVLLRKGIEMEHVANGVGAAACLDPGVCEILIVCGHMGKPVWTNRNTGAH